MASATASMVLFAMNIKQNEQEGRHLDRQAIAAVISGRHVDVEQPRQGRRGLERTARPALAFHNTLDEIDILVRVLHDLGRH